MRFKPVIKSEDVRLTFCQAILGLHVDAHGTRIEKPDPTFPTVFLGSLSDFCSQFLIMMYSNVNTNASRLNCTFKNTLSASQTVPCIQDLTSCLCSQRRSHCCDSKNQVWLHSLFEQKWNNAVFSQNFEWGMMFYSYALFKENYDSFLAKCVCLENHVYNDKIVNNIVISLCK